MDVVFSFSCANLQYLSYFCKLQFTFAHLLGFFIYICILYHDFFNTYANQEMRVRHHTAFFVVFAILAIVSCHHKDIMGGRTEEAYQRLKAVGDSVNILSPRARMLIDSALAHSADSLTFYDYYVELGRLYVLTQPDSVLQCTDRITAFAKSQKNSPRVNGLLAEARHLRANYDFLYHQNYKEAIDNNLEAYHFFLKSDMKNNASGICANIGDVYMQQSLLPEAAAWYRRALVITDSLQLPEEEAYTFYMGLGHIYCVLQDYKLSEDYFSKARKGYDKMHGNMKMTFLNNYGNLKYYSKDYAGALAVFESLDSLITDYGLKGGFEDYVCQLNMADVLVNLGRNKESMAKLEPVDSFFRANNVTDAIYYANTVRIANSLDKNDIATVRKVIDNEPPGLTSDEDMISIRERYLHDYYVKTNDEVMAVKMERAYNHRKDSIDQSREHMRSTDIMMRLTLDTLALHNQLRIKEKNEEISHSRLVWALVAGGMLLVALLLLALTLYLRKRNADNQLEIINLKISNNRNVIAPHFIFNVLKQATIQQGKEADNSIEGIIKLMRSQIAVSRKVFVTLGEELEFTKNYVNLAGSSLDGDFLFTINKSDDPSIEQRLVPSTFVQILAENAIKHALREVEGEKRLTIDIEDTPTETSISISDNGHGFDIRSRAAGTGTGLSVIRRTLALYNESHHHKIVFAIQNRTDDMGHTLGCTVRLVVPTDVGQPS